MTDFGRGRSEMDNSPDPGEMKRQVPGDWAGCTDTLVHFRGMNQREKGH